MLSAEETRALLDSIDVSTMIGLRDRALIALMTYTFSRVNAAAQQIANLDSARTTSLYDRRDDQLTLDEVERILI